MKKLLLSVALLAAAGLQAMYNPNQVMSFEQYQEISQCVKPYEASKNTSGFAMSVRYPDYEWDTECLKKLQKKYPNLQLNTLTLPSADEVRKGG